MKDGRGDGKFVLSWFGGMELFLIFEVGRLRVFYDLRLSRVIIAIVMGSLSSERTKCVFVRCLRFAFFLLALALDVLFPT